MKFSFFVILILLASYAAADQVGVVVTFPDGSVHGQCIDTDAGSNGFDLLDELTLDTTWSGLGSFGHQLCQINGVGDEVTGTSCSFSGKYWGFFTSVGNEWQYMPVGFDAGSTCWNGDLESFVGHYCASEGDVIGFRYGEFGDFPNFYTFEDVCKPLKVVEIEVDVNEKKEGGVDEFGGKIDAPPSAVVEFTIEVENDYLFDDSLELEDIEAIITIKDIDDGDDLEEELRFKDLDSKKSDKEDVEFILPQYVDDDEYDVEIEITARTSTGISQKRTISHTLEIDKERHDVVISRAQIQKEEVCAGKQNELDILITNQGRSEEEVSLSVRNTPLGLNFKDEFDLDEGDDPDEITYEKKIIFEVPQEASGEYFIDISVSAEDSLSEQVGFAVKSCDEEVSEQVQLQQKSQIKKSAAQVTQIVQATPSAQKRVERSFIEKYSVHILLGLFIGILLFVLILIVQIARRN